jgi:hypothetical protein
MRICVTLGFCIALSAGLVNGGGKEHPKDDHVLITPGGLKWVDGPPGLPPGVKVAVLFGDPSKAGMPYTIRAKMGDGYTIPPHWHPTDENVTVLSGTLIVGKGDSLTKAGMELPAGSYMRMPKEMRHYAIAKGDTVLQIHGVGPFDITYVDPSNDPRTKKEPKK